MSGYTIFAPEQSPSTVPVVIGNALPALANYINRDTPFWLSEESKIANVTALIINNVDDSIKNITSFNIDNSFDNVMVDLSGAENSVTIYTVTPQGPRPYTKWRTNFTGDVFAPNLLNTITNFITLSFPMGSAPYPSSPATGIIVGETFTVPKSGVYILDALLVMNVNPQPVVIGASDFVQIGLIQASTPPVIAAALDLKPWPMPGDVTGQDYNTARSNCVTLVAGQSYNLFWWAFNLSGTLSLGDASGGGSLKITQLC